MKRQSFLGTLLIGGMLCASCDDGLIPEATLPPQAEGYVAKLTGELTGIRSWSNPYTVVLAGFADDSDYAVVQKNLPQTDGTISLTLANIPTETKRVELCVTNTLRKHIVTLASVDLTEVEGDTIRLDVGKLNVSQFAVIQRQVFNTTCANCHGGSTSAAAGLYLTEGKSYASLIRAEATKEPGTMRVLPGDASNSLLLQALTTDISTKSQWHYDHTTEVVNDNILALIRNWIDAGATE